ncbi:MAG TPA: hypothetical protein VFI25_01360 [Planctomycetota bacterium]|jgi:hypothetical protein|nr:hypothetical protein [Planctomycetota bacterium]
MKTKVFLAMGLAAAIGAGSTPAQIAASPNFALAGEETVAIVGGGSSPGTGGAPARAAYGALGSLAPGEGASSNRQALSSFLCEFSPFAGTGPMVFGVNPGQSSTSGGIPVEIQGVRFLGVGTAQFGPTAVLTFPTSPTRTVSVVPPSGLGIPEGLVPLTVTSGGGIASLPNGFLYFPAVLASGDLVPGGDVLVRYFGPPGNGFGYAMSLGSVAPLPLSGIGGFLQLDLSGLLFVRASTFLADGSKEFQYPTPPSPALAGVTVYWQPILFPPSLPEFGNLANTTFQ